ncbi:hypothetical protein [Olivibacter jilunii]|uniref:hypothetical protein n=1 Tax=Olivibacter jilunii TaxID=985016 RepID=UPI003F13B553
MKRKMYLFVFFLSLFCIACDKSDMDYENDYEQSYKAWLDFKESSNNSYRYVVSGATWAGAAWETTITVNNGEVTGRDFRYTVFNDIRMPADGWNLETAQLMLDSLSKRYQGNTEHLPSADSMLKMLTWSENQANLNNHANTGGALTCTLDQIYEKAKSDWLKKRNNAQTFFEAKNNGIISSCGFVEDNCADDCFRGITITLVEGI